MGSVVRISVQHVNVISVGGNADIVAPCYGLLDRCVKGLQAPDLTRYDCRAQVKCLLVSLVHVIHQQVQVRSCSFACGIVRGPADHDHRVANLDLQAKPQGLALACSFPGCSAATADACPIISLLTCRIYQPSSRKYCWPNIALVCYSIRLRVCISVEC